MEAAEVSPYALGDAVEALYDGKWYAGSVVGFDVPPSSLIDVLLKGDSGPRVFGPEGLRRPAAEEWEYAQPDSGRRGREILPLLRRDTSQRSRRILPAV